MNKQRYSFWRVFWVNLAIYLFFLFVGIIFMSVSPIMNNAPNWEKFVSWHNLSNQLFSISFFAVFYFITLNRFYRLIAGRHKPVRFVRPLVFAYLLIAAYYATTYFLFDNIKFELSINEARIKDQLTPALLAFTYFISSLFIVGTSFLIAYLTYLRDDKKQRKILEAQKMQLEVEKSQANFNFLKAQINPHFLHNTLNFLYAKSLPHSNELSEGILTLSDIMRYALGPAAKEGKVLLKDEIEHVRNVIKIHQLRYSNNLRVGFEVNGVLNGATIVPFVLITIIENAFKHGDFKSAEHPIDIKLCVQNGTMHFYCHNKKKSGPKEISTGIGLDNIKKQLDLTYGKNYVLNIKDEAEFYTTELILHSI